VWYIMSNQELLALERKVDELITLYKNLEQEKRLLQAEREAWKAERAKLIKQNELARSRVEAMIERLKTMEQTNG
ncbi:MAG: TIGR02449 family protein, partial [Reinekea sp.]|nr:TIGR02449 family protein [Reinekea sp.]